MRSQVYLVVWLMKGFEVTRVTYQSCLAKQQRKFVLWSVCLKSKYFYDGVQAIMNDLFVFFVKCFHYICQYSKSPSKIIMANIMISKVPAPYEYMQSEGIRIACNEFYELRQLLLDFSRKINILVGNLHDDWNSSQ
jgi:hypothetical protein